MNIVLVTQHHSRSAQSVPLAGAFLAAALTSDEILASSCRITLCDLYPDTAHETALDSILSTKPAVIGFSTYIWNRSRTIELAHALRQGFPDLILCAGGPEPTADPYPFLSGGTFDFVVAGEGEITFIETVAALLEGRPLKGIPGVATLDDRIISLKKRHPAELLDTLPSPLLTGVLDPANYDGMLWQISRGCDFSCTYCSDPAGVRGTRRFSLERIESELRLLARSRTSQVFVLDSTFNRLPDRAKRVLRLIRKHAPHIHFHFEVRSEFIDREQARLLSSITCSLQIGLQSARNEILSGVGRRLDCNDFIMRIGLLNEEGVVFGFDLIYGLPGDTLDGFKKSLDFALDLYPNHLDIFPLGILPGAPLAHDADRLELSYLHEVPYTLQYSPTFPAEDMAEAARLALACDIFYSRGKAVAWFKGLCRALSISPSALLELFDRWLKDELPAIQEAELQDEEVWQLQRRFLTTLLKQAGSKKMLSLALDLLDYHYYYAAALMAAPPELPTEQEVSLLDYAGSCFCVAGSARLACFSFEIVDILESGEVDFSGFIRCFRRSGSSAVIYPQGGDVLTEPLTDTCYTLLKRLDGATRLSDVAEEAGIELKEATAFIEFCLAEGIVTVVPQGE